MSRSLSNRTTLILLFVKQQTKKWKRAKALDNCANIKVQQTLAIRSNNFRVELIFFFFRTFDRGLGNVTCLLVIIINQLITNDCVMFEKNSFTWKNCSVDKSLKVFLLHSNGVIDVTVACETQ